MGIGLGTSIIFGRKSNAFRLQALYEEWAAKKKTGKLSRFYLLCFGNKVVENENR